MKRIARFVWWVFHRRTEDGFKFTIKQCWWISGECF